MTLRSNSEGSLRSDSQRFSEVGGWHKLQIIITYLLFNLFKYFRKEHMVYHYGYTYKIINSSNKVTLTLKNSENVGG